MQSIWLLYLGTLCVWLYQLPYHVLMLSIVGAVYSSRRKRIVPGRDKRFVILVPAHNEEAQIAETLKSLKGLAYPKENVSICVIADNCDDATATRARECGVDVLERRDDSRRSKGFALEFAIHELHKKSHPPDAVVVIDADTQVDAELLSYFAGRLAAGQEWIQAYYTVSNPEASLRTRWMTYAFSLFNGTWLWGQDALGLGCAFRGNGMALSWSALQRVPWQAYGLAEDLEFSWYLRSQGERIYFAPEARVYGEMLPESGKAAEKQQLRWEHGRKELRQRYDLKIHEFAFAPWQRYLLAADLWMPPLSRYVSLLVLFASGTGLFAILFPEGSQAAYKCLQFLLGLSFGSLGLYLLSPFVRLDLPLRYLGALSTAPLYMLWKVRLLGSKAPTAWTRTERSAGKRDKSLR